VVLTDRDDIRVAETDEELLTVDVSDDALERTASVGVGLSIVTLNFGTGIVAIAAAPVLKHAKPERLSCNEYVRPLRHCPH
jgi:hypothetical protein